MREVTPLIVTATVTKPIVRMRGGLNLASLLAWAAAEEMALPPPKEHPVPIDIPVMCLWRDPAGWPLWAATDLYPVGERIEHRQWLHRRYPADRADLAKTMKVNLAAGPYKERRVLVYADHCATWRGAVLATDAEAVKRMLSRIRSLGARTAAGFGAVHAWHFEEADFDAEFVLARRSVPVASGLRQGEVESLPWVPPYWHASLWTDCVRGQPCF